MRLIDRYLLKNFFVPFFYCIFAFVILYITYDVSVNLDIILKNQVGILSLVKYYAFFVPVILVNSTPITILLALLYSLGSMNRHHEIVAMRASGIHIDRIILPFIIVGTISAVVIFLINDQIVSRYSFEENALRDELFDDEPMQASTIWKNFPFRNPSTNRDWFIELFDYKHNTLQGVTVREFDDNGKITRKIIAKEAHYNNGEWEFLDGTIYYYDDEGIPAMSNGAQSLKPKYFEKIQISYDISPDDFENSRRNISSMNFRALLRYLRMQSKESGLYRKILVDLHYKIAFPFVCIIAVLIGIPFAIKTQRGGFIKGIGVCIIIFLAYYVISVLSLTLGKKGYMTPLIAVWLPNVIFLVFGGFLIKNAA